MYLKKKINYKVFDNFIEKKIFKNIESLKFSKIEQNKIKVYYNSIAKNGTIKQNQCIDKNTLKLLHKKYHKKAIKILNELYPEKVKLYDYSEFYIIQTGPNYKFPIHDDIPSKLLSGVIYIRPNKNIGTIFYGNKNGKKKEVIKWKKNRAVFFSRRERETWHSYEGDGKSERFAMVYNLMTYNIKEVCRIERKSYLISMLRYKINPYFYRFFKVLF